MLTRTALPQIHGAVARPGRSAEDPRRRWTLDAEVAPPLRPVRAYVPSATDPSRGPCCRNDRSRRPAGRPHGPPRTRRGRNAYGQMKRHVAQLATARRPVADENVAAQVGVPARRDGRASRTLSGGGSTRCGPGAPPRPRRAPTRPADEPCQSRLTRLLGRRHGHSSSRSFATSRRATRRSELRSAFERSNLSRGDEPAVAVDEAAARRTRRDLAAHRLTVDLADLDAAGAAVLHELDERVGPRPSVARGRGT